MSVTRNWELDLSLALTLADVADEVSRQWFGKSAHTNVKQDGSPVIVEVDLEIERRIRSILKERRPLDRILGEELGLSQQACELGSPTWIIDPLDHTRHFSRGNPEYGTLIALCADGRPRVGVVSAPSLGRRWWAVQGGGAWADGTRIFVSRTSSVKAAHFGIAGHREWLQTYNWSQVSDLLSRVNYAYGTAGGFLPAMMVASSQLDAFVEPWGEIWDHSASAIIVEEAGGKASTLSGDPVTGGSLLISNGLLHDELLSFFKANINT